MNPIFLIAGVVLFVAGIVLGRQSESPSSKVKVSKNEVQATSSASSVTPSETPIPTIVETPAGQSTPMPTQKPSITNTPSQQKAGTNISIFQYPNSTIDGQSSTTLTLRSNDSPETITSWYESKIKDLGYSARSTAKTNSNGNIENKLGGGNSDGSVTIDIKKNSSSSSTTITVTLGADNSSDVRINIQNTDAYL